jgi:hypothetical protein
MHTTDEEIRKKIKLKFFASKIIFCLMVVPILLFIIAMETKIFN